MRVLRFHFLTSPGAEAPPTADAANRVNGLDAFGSEHNSAVNHPASAQPSVRAYGWATGILMLAVLLEAYPTALWLMARVQPIATAASVDPPAPVADLPALATVPPCEATPPEPSAKRNAASAGAPRSRGRAARATPTPALQAPPAPRMLAGAVAVNGPVPLLVFERGRLVGSTQTETLMLPAGKHDLEFVNETVGYRVSRGVTVQAGETSTIRLEAPMGTVHINAVPWAEVWIDGQRVGETPIGNLSTRIGNREVVFRHPDLGERRATVLVTLTAPARISMDLRNK